MKHFAWFTGLAATCMLFACLGSELASQSEQEDPLVLEESEALKIDPCALVRCRAGTQCEVHDGRPVCVRPAPEPECSSDKECRTFSNYCEGCACLALSVNEVDPVNKESVTPLEGWNGITQLSAIDLVTVRVGASYVSTTVDDTGVDYHIGTTLPRILQTVLTLSIADADEFYDLTLAVHFR